MQQFQHILVAIHPEEITLAGLQLPAIRDAVRLSQSFGSRLMLITAAEETAAATEALQTAVETISVEGVNADTRVLSGDLAKAIQAFSEEFQPDLVVVGRNSTNGERRILGPASKQIAWQGTCPVWLAAQEAEGSDVINSLVPIDLNDAGYDLLDLVVAGGQTMDMRVNLLHVVEGSDATSEAEFELHDQLAMTDFRTLQFGLNPIVETGDVEQVISEAIKREQPTLLVIGCGENRHGAGWTLRTERLLTEAVCSVLLVKPNDIEVTRTLEEAVVQWGHQRDSGKTLGGSSNTASRRVSDATRIDSEQRPIYMDHHATTPVDPAVLEAMLPYFTESFGNAGSMNHRFGTEAANAVAVAREQVAALLGCDVESIVFTSGATESNNLALKGVMSASGKRCHLIVNAAEHRAVLDPAKRLKRDGFDVTVLPIRDFNAGAVEPRDVLDAIRDDTALVSVMLANNEVGAVNAIPAIAGICRARDVLLHVDATQAPCWMDVNVRDLKADLLSLSAHKMYGPKGIGALFVRRGETRIPMKALIDGGGQERQLRSGTLPVPLIVGFGKASELSVARRPADVENIVKLRDELWWQLAKNVAGIQLNGPSLDAHDPSGHRLRLPNNLNVSIPDVDGEALMTGLKRIAVSSGSACTLANPQPSHVLKAMGLSDQLTRASLRFGLGRNNTLADVEVAARGVTELVERLRGN